MRIKIVSLYKYNVLDNMHISSYYKLISGVMRLSNNKVTLRYRTRIRTAELIDSSARLESDESKKQVKTRQKMYRSEMR